MVSLLFVANNPAIEKLKTSLQPLLKLKIDVVSDFDHGLKDVFEKRPSTVCIQEQIAGVSGESVARHIQMLLGNGAPSFILMHEGNSKVKQIKGLFDYLLDLHQPEGKLLGDMLSTLQSLMGSQWDKIFISPKPETAAELSATIVSPESNKLAEQLVDDLLSDIDSLGDHTKQKITVEQIDHLNVDDVASLLAAKAKASQEEEYAAAQEENPFVVLHETSDKTNLPVTNEESAGLIGKRTSEPLKSTDIKIQDENLSSVSLSPKQHIVENRENLPSTPPIPPVVVKSEIVPKIIEPQIEKAEKTEKTVTTQASQPVKPAEFTVPSKPSPEEDIPEDLLLEFEKNFRSQSASRSKFIGVAVVLVFAVVGSGWYVFKKRSELLSSIYPRAVSTIKKSETKVQLVQSVKPKKSQDVISSATSQNAKPTVESSSEQVKVAKHITNNSSNASKSKLPSFIPEKGYDQSYSSKKPGWDRYLGLGEEFRLFKSEGHIKAVQVLSLNGATISEKRLKSIVSELTGTDNYKTASTEQKLGFKVSHGVIESKGELLIYRKKDKIKAFVVSLK